MKSPNLKSLIAISSVAALLFATGCGKKSNDTSDSSTNAQTTAPANPAEAVKQAMNAAGEQHKSAAHAIDTKTLASWIPNLNGYTAHEPSLTSMNMEGVQYAVAERQFENGQKNVKVTVADYNYIQGLTAGLRMAMQFSHEDENEISHGETFGSNQGWVDWKKKDNEGTVGIIVNDRIFVIVEGSGGVTLDDLKAIANQVNLDAAAKAST